MELMKAAQGDFEAGFPEIVYYPGIHLIGILLQEASLGGYRGAAGPPAEHGSVGSSISKALFLSVQAAFRRFPYSSKSPLGRAFSAFRRISSTLSRCFT